MGNLPPGIKQFLKPFDQQDGAFPRIQSAPAMALGSGFFVSAGGYLVTNNHVVQNAKTVTVTMDDGKILDAKVVGTDPKTDLALLKVNQAGDYPFVSFAKHAQGRRLGLRDRQSLRPWRDCDRRHRVGRRPRHW